MNSHISPYISLPMGGDKSPFDLNAPGVVLEIKQALIALAVRGSDPVNNSDPIQEDAWKNIVTTGDYANGWDGPTADEFVCMLSRYRGMIDGPYLQSSAPAPVGIVGGPQPMARGLEVLAGAVEEVLGGMPTMTKYLAWRDGYFDPPSSVSAPDPTDPVKFCTFQGEPWNTLGYTPIWGSAPEYIKQYGIGADNQLFDAWKRLLEAGDETQRDRIYNEIKLARIIHDKYALEGNKGAPIPECGNSWQWNATTGACEKKPVVITLPVTTIIGEKDLSVASLAAPIASVVVLGAIGSLLLWSAKTKDGVPGWALGNNRR